MCGYNGADTPIYVDEQLTQHTYEILTQAKALKKMGMKYVWTSNGDVLCREQDDSPMVRINSLEKIKEIEKRMALSNKRKKNSSSKKHNGKTQTPTNIKVTNEEEEDEFFSESDT